MTNLLRKEIPHLIPPACLVVIAMAGQAVYEPIASRPDEMTWASASHDLDPGAGVTSQVVITILGLIVAYSLLPREHEERTIEFLYALPVTRRRIFAMKVLAGLVVLLGAIALGLIVDLLLLSFNPQTFSGRPFRIGMVLRLFFLLGTYGLVVLSHGMVLSFFRRFGLILYGIYWWILWGLQRGPYPLSWLDHSAILTWEYFGTRLLIP